MDGESTAFVAVKTKFSARNQTKPKLDYSCLAMKCFVKKAETRCLENVSLTISLKEIVYY